MTRRTKQVMGLLAAVGAAVVVGYFGVQGSVRTARDLPDEPDDVTLFSIDCVNYDSPLPGTGEKLHGYPILGKVTLANPADRRMVVSAIKEAATYTGPHPACFNPRHIVRVVNGSTTTDLIICFECVSYQIRRPNGTITGGGQISRAGQPSLDTILTGAGVHIVPNIFPESAQK